jgi:hypothetical protein
MQLAGVGRRIKEEHSVCASSAAEYNSRFSGGMSGTALARCLNDGRAPPRNSNSNGDGGGDGDGVTSVSFTLPGGVGASGGGGGGDKRGKSITLRCEPHWSAELLWQPRSVLDDHDASVVGIHELVGLSTLASVKHALYCRCHQTLTLSSFLSSFLFFFFPSIINLPGRLNHVKHSHCFLSFSCLP